MKLRPNTAQSRRAETGGGQDLQRGPAAARGPHLLLPLRGDAAVRRPHDSRPLPRAHVQDHGRRNLDWDGIDILSGNDRRFLNFDKRLCDQTKKMKTTK